MGGLAGQADRPADRPAESYGRYGLFLRMENEIYKLRDGAVI